MKRANKNVWQPYYLSFSLLEKSTQKKKIFFYAEAFVKVNSNNG